MFIGKMMAQRSVPAGGAARVLRGRQQALRVRPEPASGLRSVRLAGHAPRRQQAVRAFGPIHLPAADNRPMHTPKRPSIDAPTALLGGLSPAGFMRRHWQRRPLLVRRAWPDAMPPLTRPALFALAAREGVESRLVQRQPGVLHDQPGAWRVRHGPLPRRALPPLHQPGWTLLVQGMDLHVPAARALLEAFRFGPDARLDDLMLSWASDGGGVGPHVDRYDVFLLQLQGRRRWRIAPPAGGGTDPAWVPGAPLKLLAGFEPTQEWLLEPGDLLYLPPGWGHDGIAEGECQTASIGYRAPQRDELAGELLQRLGDAVLEAAAHAPGSRYRDAGQAATDSPAAIPAALQAYAAQAMQRALAQPGVLDRALGEWLTEPKPTVWFDAQATPPAPGDGVRLALATRMLYDSQHVFINGEALDAGGRDFRLMQRLADTRALAAAEVARLSPGARALLDEWLAAGWVQPGLPASCHVAATALEIR
jgi:50S ribosomal protein L16 3-hydroxylase